MQALSFKRTLRCLSLLSAILFLVGPLAAQPPSPTNLSAEKTASGIRLSWSAPSEQVDYLRLFRRRPKLGEETLLILSPDLSSGTTSYTDNDVNIADEVYIYRLRAYRDDTRSDYSNRVRVTVGPGDFGSSAESPPTDTPVPPPTNTPLPPPTNTPLPPPSNTAVPPPTNTPPPPTSTLLPTNTPLPPSNTPAPTDTPDPAITRNVGALRLSSNQPGALAAAWDTPEEAPSDYRINWAKVGEPFPTWTDSSGNAFPTGPSYTITGLQGGERYKVQVRPRYVEGPRPWSDAVEVMVMASPTDTPIPPSDTPSPTAVPRNQPSQNLGRSVNTNQQDSEPRQQPSATATSTATATSPTTATPSATATPTLEAQSQNQQATWPPSQELIQPAQPSATQTLVIARQHGTSATHTPTPHPDRVALEAIYDALGGDNWTNNDNWKTNQGFNNWYGVTASGGRVTKLRLSNNKLHGTLPAAIGELTELEELDLSFNRDGGNNNNRHLSGVIPPEIGNLRSLKVLSLFYSKMNGSLPTELGDLRDLEDLSLGYNEFSGSIPTQLGNLRSLTRLDLGVNDLSGSIPSQLGSLSTLTYLNMSQNDLSGSIPSGLGNLRNLEELNLSENDLTGSIPSSFNNFRSVMTDLYLSHNQLSGSIPLYLLNFTELDTLHLGFNNFTGCEPDGLRRAVNSHDLGSVGLDRCTNTLTNTPAPTNTPVPTATPDPSIPTATPAPGFTTFALSGQQRSITVSFRAETSVVTRARVYWRQEGRSSFQSSLYTVPNATSTRIGQITGLQPDVVYEVYMQGFDDNNVMLGRTSLKRVRTPKDLQVYGVRVSAGVNSLDVSWNTADHHAIYHIRWESEKGGGTGYDSGIEENSYTITRLEAGETYEVQVSVTNRSDKTGPWSSAVSGRPRSGATAPSRLGGPSVAQDGSSRKLDISWSVPSIGSDDALTAFELRVYDQARDEYTYNTVSIPTTSSPIPTTRTLAVRSYNNTYRVAVRAQTRDGGWALWSNETSFTMPAQGLAVDPADNYVPAQIGAPTLSTSNTTTNNPKVGVAWTTPNTGATNPLLEFELRYVSSNDPVGRNFTYGATRPNGNAITAVSIIGLPVRRLYTFSIRARNATGFGAWSRTSQIFLPDRQGNQTPEPTYTPTPAPSVPGVPTNLNVWALTDDQTASYVQFTWNEPTNDGNSRITGYKVRYRWSGQDWIEVNRSGGYRQFDFKTGDANHDAVYQRRYEFQIAAINSVGQGNWSGSVYGTPLKAPDQVEEPTLVAGTGQLRVSWTRPDSNDRGITHYQLFYAEAARSSSDPGTTIERVTGTSYTISGLTSGVEYKVAARAVSSIGEGNWSQYANGTPD